MLMQTSTDMTRFVRNFKSIIGSAHQEEFLEEQKELAAKVVGNYQREADTHTPTESPYRDKVHELE
jgi:hypothetical protein